MKYEVPAGTVCSRPHSSRTVAVSYGGLLLVVFPHGGPQHFGQRVEVRSVERFGVLIGWPSGNSFVRQRLQHRTVPRWFIGGWQLLGK